MEEFRRIKRELVAKGAIIDYYQDTMQIPNGNIAKWDLIDHKGAAAVVAVPKNNPREKPYFTVIPPQNNNPRYVVAMRTSAMKSLPLLHRTYQKSTLLSTAMYFI